MDFTKEQWEAITHKDGPMMVIAGPGAGKTMVTTHRLRYMVNEYHIAPESILVITFTRAAAMEMEERFGKICPVGLHRIRFGTFHSVFYEMLRELGMCQGDGVMEEQDKIRYLIPFFMNTMGLSEEEASEKTDEFMSEYDRYRNEGRDLKEISSFSCCERDIFLQAVGEYIHQKELHHQIDFEDMQMRLLEILQRDAGALHRLQRRYQYFLLDEYQDINRVQFTIMEKLCSAAKNIFVVGDEDQSIYGFRGSDPRFLLEFPKTYPDCKEVRLPDNYRCSEEVVALSQRVIAHNQNRFSKQLRAARGPKVPVEYRFYRSPGEEAIGIRDELLWYHRHKGIAYEEMAILYRTHQQSDRIVKALADTGIPFYSKEKLRNIYEHWLARDLRAYFRLIYDPSDKESFQRTAKISRLPDFIVEEAIWRGGSLPEQLAEIPRLTLQQRGKAEEWLYHFNQMKHRSIRDGITYLWTRGGYKEYAERYAEEKRLPFHFLEEIVQALWEDAGACKTPAEWEEKRKEYEDRLNSTAPRGVRLCTMHGAKGLEFPLVWCASVSKGIIPHPRAEDVEEERRIFYVAVTRAKDHLILSQYSSKPRQPSIFIKESINLEESVNNGILRGFFREKPLRKSRKMVK